MKIKDRSIKRWCQAQRLAKIASASHGELLPVHEIDPNTNERIEKSASYTPKTVVNDLTKVVRFLYKYRGRIEFVKKMEWIVKKKGIAALSEGQIAAVVKIMGRQKSRETHMHCAAITETTKILERRQAAHQTIGNKNKYKEK